MKSGAAFKSVPDPRSGSLVKHPTTAFGAAPPSREAEVPYVRRAPRQERQSPTVPWFYLITSVAILACMIMLVVKQRADLVHEQFKLIQHKADDARVLKERAELKLTIQRLTSLDRVDGMVRKNLKMVRPGHRIVLDLSQYDVGTPVAARVAAQRKAEEATP